MLTEQIKSDLGQALAAFDDGNGAPWAALAPLARLPVGGVDVSIDFAASDALGAAIVVTRPRPKGLERLTPRQRQVALALVSGASNKEIANALNLSPATVKDHVHDVLRRLGVARRGQVAALLHGAKV